MILDLTQPVESSTDLSTLRRVISALIGQPFLHAEFSYGDELKLHFGKPVPYSTAKMANKTRGAWRLTTRASHWRFLLQNPGRVIESDPTTMDEQRALSNAALEQAMGPGLAGQIVTSVSLLTPSSADGGIGVSLLFEDGSTFAVWPSEEPDDSDQEGEPIADWELFTPFGMYLRVGPGPVWQYVSATAAVANV